jgi:hypothetical protein
MFWKCIRWGGTLIVMLALFGAILLGSWNAEPDMPPQPASGELSPTKNFNL